MYSDFRLRCQVTLTISNWTDYSLGQILVRMFVYLNVCHWIEGY